MQNRALHSIQSSHRKKIYNTTQNFAGLYINHNDKK